MFKDKQVSSLAGGADVTQYMKATHVSSWVVLVLAIVLVLCGVAWMTIGTIKTTISVTGVNENGKLTFYASPTDALQMSAGQKIEIDGKTVGVITGYGVPSSTEEIVEHYNNQFLTQQLTLYKSNAIGYADLDVNACPNGVLTVDVVTAEMAPFSLFFG